MLTRQPAGGWGGLQTPFAVAAANNAITRPPGIRPINHGRPRVGNFPITRDLRAITRAAVSRPFAQCSPVFLGPFRRLKLCWHARAHTHTRTYTHRHTHTRAHTQTDIRTHTNIHTHTHTHNNDDKRQVTRAGTGRPPLFREPREYERVPDVLS